MKKNCRRGSVLIGSLILIVIAAFAVATWMTFVAHGARAADRDRSRMHAFYAAEAGVEQVVEYFNHPTRYFGQYPDNYNDLAVHPASITLAHPVQPEYYELFEGYVTAYAQNGDGLPIDRNSQIIWDTRNNRLISGGEPVILGYTYFTDRSGSPAEISLTSKVPSFELDLDGIDTLAFVGRGDRLEARVERIQIVHPSDFTEQELLIATQQGPVICKIISTGRASNGVTVRVESMITQNIIPNISSPAAIISESGVSFDGNFEVHWGEVWANSNVDIGNETWLKLPRLGENYRRGTGSNATIDPWFRMRTSGYLHQGNSFADGRTSSGFGPNQLTEASDGVLFRSPFDRSARPSNLNPNQSWVHDGRDNLLQNQSLNFPSYEYTHWKNFFQSFSLPYFFTDTGGNIYGMERNPNSPDYGNIVSKSYDDWFNVAADSPNYWDYDSQFAFIDSVPVDNNGTPAPIVNGVPVINETFYPRGPGDPAHQFANISISGSGTHSRGVMFVAGNLRATGTGNPPRASALLDEDGNPAITRPDGSVPNNRDDFRIFHNGFIYSWGQIDFGGNRSVYGSVYAEQGYSSGGTPTVYYNSRLRDGTYFSVNQSRVRRTLWDFNRPVVAEVSP